MYNLSAQEAETGRSYQDHHRLHSRLCLNPRPLKSYFDLQAFLFDNYPRETFYMNTREYTHISTKGLFVKKEKKGTGKHGSVVKSTYSCRGFPGPKWQFTTVQNYSPVPGDPHTCMCSNTVKTQQNIHTHKIVF